MGLMDLSYCGFCPFCNWWITVLYVVLEGKNSYSKQVLSGVPQGTVLAPLLFLLYSNNRVNNKYADDVLLYSYMHSECDSIALQQDFDKLTEWAHTWLMEFNMNT